MIQAHEAIAKAKQSPLDQVSRLITEAANNGLWSLRVSFTQAKTNVHYISGRRSDTIQALQQAGFKVTACPEYDIISWDHPMD